MFQKKSSRSSMEPKPTQNQAHEAQKRGSFDLIRASLVGNYKIKTNSTEKCKGNSNTLLARSTFPPVVSLVTTNGPPPGGFLKTKRQPPETK